MESFISKSFLVFVGLRYHLSQGKSEQKSKHWKFLERILDKKDFLQIKLFKTQDIKKAFFEIVKEEKLPTAVESYLKIRMVKLKNRGFKS